MESLILHWMNDFYHVYYYFCLGFFSLQPLLCLKYRIVIDKVFSPISETLIEFFVSFFFNTPATHFLKYFRFNWISWNANVLFLIYFEKNRRVSEKAIFRVQSQILTYYACAPFNWFLWQDSFGYKEKSENCGVLCTDTFCNRILAMNNYQYTVFNYLEK